MAETLIGTEALTKAKSAWSSSPSLVIFCGRRIPAQLALMVSPVADLGTEPRSMTETRFDSSVC
ncbi:MAG: hypothetical protein ACLURK_02415 [Bifidobacterium sp.]